MELPPGRCRRHAQFLAVADLALSPRHYGGNIPGKVPAYLIAGLPVVGTDVAGVRELVDATVGALVPPGVPAAPWREPGCRRSRRRPPAWAAVRRGPPVSGPLPCTATRMFLGAAQEAAFGQCAAWRRPGFNPTPRAERELLALGAVALFFAGLMALQREGGLSGLTTVRPGWAVVALGAALLANNGLCSIRWWLLLVARPSLPLAVRRYTEGVFLSLRCLAAVVGGRFLLRAVATEGERSSADGVAGVLADRAVGGLVTVLCAAPAVILLTPYVWAASLAMRGVATVLGVVTVVLVLRLPAERLRGPRQVLSLLTALHGMLGRR